MNKILVGSASVGFEQPRDKHFQKMSPEQRKTASPKKIPAKKTSPKKRKAEEATAGKEPLSKKTRVDTSCDQVNFLTTSDPVLDIFSASGGMEVINFQELYL